MNTDTNETPAWLTGPDPHFPNGVTKLMEEGMTLCDAMLIAAQHGDPIAVQSSVIMFANSTMDKSGKLPNREEIFEWANESDIDLRFITQDWPKIENYLSNIRPRRQMAWTNGPLPGPKE